MGAEVCLPAPCASATSCTLTADVSSHRREGCVEAAVEALSRLMATSYYPASTSWSVFTLGSWHTTFDPSTPLPVSLSVRLSPSLKAQRVGACCAPSVLVSGKCSRRVLCRGTSTVRTPSAAAVPPCELVSCPPTLTLTSHTPHAAH